MEEKRGGGGGKKERTIARGFATARSHNLHFLDTERRKCHFLTPLLLRPSSCFPPSPSIVPGPNSVARARARTTFPRNSFSPRINRDLVRGRFKGADVFPKRPRPAAAFLPREKIYSLSLSFVSLSLFAIVFRISFPLDAARANTISREILLKRAPNANVEISIEQ